jgi:single-strand DNA-binding protein
MSGETVIVIIGNLVEDPQLAFTPSGVAVAKFRLASTPRTYNKQTQAYEDGESLFLTCSVWRQAAENCAETLAKGMRVIVQGQLKQRSYEDKQQVKRTVYELDVLEIGPSLRNATAKVTKVSGGSGSGRQDARQAAQQGASRPPVEDPWASSSGGGQAGAWSEEPPF